MRARVQAHGVTWVSKTGVCGPPLRESPGGDRRTFLFTKQPDSKRCTAQFYDIFTGIDENVLELFWESIVSAASYNGQGSQKEERAGYFLVSLDFPIGL